MRTNCLTCKRSLNYGATVTETFLGVETVGSWAECECGSKFFAADESDDPCLNVPA